MFGLGTIINTVAIALAGILGIYFSSFVKDRYKDSIQTICGVSVLFLGISGAVQGLLSIQDNSLTSVNSLKLVICLVLGAVLGELINIEDLFEKFGKWLKNKTGNQSDNKFVDAFLTSTFTVCIGAMAVVGGISDGLNHDPSILITKSILDFVFIFVMTGTLGKGCAFSAIPVFVLQGSITLLSFVISPILTANAIADLSMVGSVLIFCVGMNLIWDKKIRVANMIPSLIFAIIASYIPF